MKIATFARRITLGAAAALCASCTAAPSGSPVQSTVTQSSVLRSIRNALQTPALIAVSGFNGRLQFWPIQPQGGKNPQQLSGHVGSPFGLGNAAADGHIIAISDTRPNSVVLYNVDTQTLRSLPDPFGKPSDVAFDRNHNLYAVNFKTPGSVVMYAAGSRNPKNLVCNQFDNGGSIAVDNEGDIFINGYRANVPGVAEIPNGPGGPEPQNCTRLPLNAEAGPAGLAIDPQTDDLIVLDDPSCAGGGVIVTIYHKPYQKSTGHSFTVPGECPYGIRLNADSTLMFIQDTTPSGSRSFILQFSYPDGRSMGAYSGGQPRGYTTIPNTLPN